MHLYIICEHFLLFNLDRNHGFDAEPEELPTDHGDGGKKLQVPESQKQP